MMSAVPVVDVRTNQTGSDSSRSRGFDIDRCLTLMTHLVRVVLRLTGHANKIVGSSQSRLPYLGRQVSSFPVEIYGRKHGSSHPVRSVDD